MKRVAFVLSAALTLCAGSAFAAPLYCSGNVTAIYIDSYGDLFLFPTYHSDYQMVCNFNADWKAVSAQTCWSWFALLTTAKTKQIGVTLYYDTTYTCATLPTYGAAPAPGYVRFGP